MRVVLVKPVKLVSGAGCSDATSVHTAPGGLGVAAVVVVGEIVWVRGEVVVIVAIVLRGEEERVMVVVGVRSLPVAPVMIDTPMSDFSDSCGSLQRSLPPPPPPPPPHCCPDARCRSARSRSLIGTCTTRYLLGRSTQIYTERLFNTSSWPLRAAVAV